MANAALINKPRQERPGMKAGAKQIAAQNRRARHDYRIEDRFEAGLILTGSEVKSLRGGRASIGEAYVTERAGELYLQGAHIPAYEAATDRKSTRLNSSH